MLRDGRRRAGRSPRTGYREGGPEAISEASGRVRQVYENVLALKARSCDKPRGWTGPSCWTEIVEGYRKLGNEPDEVAAWSKEIIALDPDNKAGLKVKYEFPMILAEASSSEEGREMAPRPRRRSTRPWRCRAFRGNAAGRLHDRRPRLLHAKGICRRRGSRSEGGQCGRPRAPMLN